MRFDENLVLGELRRVAAARRLLVDTSALICLENLGLLPKVRQLWKLSTIAEVMAEWRLGSPQAPDLAILPALPQADYPGLVTDRKLVVQAQTQRLPLLSEDRRILQAAEENQLGALCSLWLVAGLEQAGLVSREDSLAAREILATRYRYDSKRLGLFDQMLFLLDKGEI